MGVAARADVRAVGPGAAAPRAVDDEVDLAGRDELDGVDAARRLAVPRRTLATRVRPGRRWPRGVGGAGGGDDREAELDEAAGRASRPAGLVAVGEREEHACPLSGSRSPAAIWLLANARPKVRSMPMTSPVERISGPSRVSTSGKRLNGSTASFTATWPPSTGGAQQALVPQLGQRGADHHPGRDLGQRHARRLGHERHGAAGARVGLDDEHLALLHRVLHVDEAARRRARRRCARV